MAPILFCRLSCAPSISARSGKGIEIRSEMRLQSRPCLRWSSVAGRRPSAQNEPPGLGLGSCCYDSAVGLEVCLAELSERRRSEVEAQRAESDRKEEEEAEEEELAAGAAAASIRFTSKHCKKIEALFTSQPKALRVPCARREVPAHPNYSTR